jgi:REP element-mobilizing transposase RayT
MSHTSGNILLHVIFSTQGRRPLIKPEFGNDLFAYLGGIVREMRGTALIVNGEPDHVHMLIRVRPAHSASEVVRVVKANSSRWVREKHSAGFAWQTGLRGVQCQRVERAGGYEVHRWATRASSEAIVPGGVHHVFEEESCGV